MGVLLPYNIFVLKTRNCNIIAVKFYAKVVNMNVAQVYEQVYIPS